MCYLLVKYVSEHSYGFLSVNLYKQAFDGEDVFFDMLFQALIVLIVLIYTKNCSTPDSVAQQPV